MRETQHHLSRFREAASLLMGVLFVDPLPLPEWLELPPCPFAIKNSSFLLIFAIVNILPDLYCPDVTVQVLAPPAAV